MLNSAIARQATISCFDSKYTFEFILIVKNSFISIEIITF